MNRIGERVAVPLIAAAIGGLIVGGISLASIPDAGGVIHGCYDSGGVLHVIDSPNQSCAAGQTALDWNQAGPRGPSNAFAAYHDVKTPLSTDASAPTTLIDLKLQPGAYVIFAKATVAGGVTTAYTAICTLTAGGDSDTQVFGAAGNSTDPITFPFGPGPLEVTHVAKVQQDALLACAGTAADGGTARNAKLIAIKVSKLVNSPQ